MQISLKINNNALKELKYMQWQTVQKQQYLIKYQQIISQND